MEKVKEFYHRYLIRHTLFRSVSFLLKCLPGGDYVKDAERGGRPGWRRTRPCPKRWRDVRAAVICDDMTWASLQNTGHVVYLTPADWFEKLEEEKPDLLFCEATWSGLSSKDCCWEGRIIRDTGVWPENRFILKRILRYCKEAGIPTVFWNKEDPVSDNERYHFTETALLFDHIFTTAQERIPVYEALGHKSVHLMMFGYSPELFPLLGPAKEPGTAVFFGGWYGRLPDRCEDTVRMLDWVLNMGLRLVIYDRQYGTDDPVRQFPERFRPYTRPGVPYKKISEELEAYQYLINLNSVKDSQTMFARRVFEGMASGRMILSNDSVGMRRLFPHTVWYLGEDFDTSREAEAVAQNRKIVSEQFTMEAQMDQMLRAICEDCDK